MTPFDVFWAAYPRHDAKKDALKAWTKLNPSPELIEQILAALAWQRETDQWTKDDGQFIPLPATYLRNERWTDERRTKDRRGAERCDPWGGMVWPCPHETACSSQLLCYRYQQSGVGKLKAS